MPQTLANPVLNDIDTAALKQTMAAVTEDPRRGIARFQVTTCWQGGTKSRTHVAGWELGGQQHPKNFTIDIDEPAELLGTNTAPNPQEYLMAAVNACLMATYVGACAVQGIELEHLEIETRGELDLRGFLGLDQRVKPGYEALDYTVRIKGNGTRQQFEAVHNWVAATSPNYYNMANAVRMKPQLVIE